ncbi:MAG: hypothetical protein ABS35_28330 [Kaistia sp. SCN 65-12]|nr:MAG: hypothetical protein ABS35_28330 [Kaistia sp. SCN 65-12]
MDYAVVISAIVLGLSVLATAAKFLDWFLHSDPKTMVRTVRWMLLLLIIIGVPLLIMMLLREQWVGAMLLGAGMLIVGTFLKWRAILGPLNTLFSHFRPKPRPFEMPPVWEEEEETATDPKAVARAAAILEAYVRQTAPNALPAEMRRLTHVVRDDDEDEDNVSNMTVKEALEVLGLPDGAVIVDVHTAHRRLMRMADPDEGGSPYLAAKIDQARDVLIDVLRRRSKPAAIGSAAPKRLPKN